MTKNQLTNDEFNPYYEAYLKLVAADVEIINGLTSDLNQTSAFFESIPVEKIHYQYEEGKWTPKEILQHLVDTERIFAYRALRVARFDTTDLPGFDENKYVATSIANLKSLDQLLDEFISVRKASIGLYKGFNEEMLLQIGQADQSPISVRAIAFILIGHSIHHQNVIKSRYL
ncbi:MAG: DinB family protein [Bacteroidota bacterium]